jgi:hypothetical protein
MIARLFAGLALVALVAWPAPAEVLTRPQLFALYVRLVPPAQIAARMEQLFGNLPAGAVKTQAAALLKADLQAAIDGRRSGIAELYTAPLDQDETDVGDTDL